MLPESSESKHAEDAYFLGSGDKVSAFPWNERRFALRLSLKRAPTVVAAAEFVRWSDAEAGPSSSPLAAAAVCVFFVLRQAAKKRFRPKIVHGTSPACCCKKKLFSGVRLASWDFLGAFLGTRWKFLPRACPGVECLSWQVSGFLLCQMVYPTWTCPLSPCSCRRLKPHCPPHTSLSRYVLVGVARRRLNDTPRSSRVIVSVDCGVHVKRSASFGSRAPSMTRASS